VLKKITYKGRKHRTSSRKSSGTVYDGSSPAKRQVAVFSGRSCPSPTLTEAETIEGATWVNPTLFPTLSAAELEALVEQCWLHTYSGCKLNLVKPDHAAINVKDAGRGLAYTYRYNAQSLVLINVLEHSILLSLYFAKIGAPIKLQYFALLHDIAEYGIGDIPSPLKQMLKKTVPWWNPMESHLEAVIWRKFGISAEDVACFKPLVKKADTAILHNEHDEIMSPSEHSWGLTGKPLPLARFGLKLQGWSPKRAEWEFIRRLGWLQRRLGLALDLEVTAAAAATVLIP
jgi:hypothetical protein